MSAPLSKGSRQQPQSSPSRSTASSASSRCHPCASSKAWCSRYRGTQRTSDTYLRVSSRTQSLSIRGHHAEGALQSYCSKHWPVAGLILLSFAMLHFVSISSFHEETNALSWAAAEPSGHICSAAGGSWMHIGGLRSICHCLPQFRPDKGKAEHDTSPLAAALCRCGPETRLYALQLGKSCGPQQPDPALP